MNQIDRHADIIIECALLSPFCKLSSMTYGREDYKHRQQGPVFLGVNTRTNILETTSSQNMAPGAHHSWGWQERDRDACAQVG